MPPQLKTNATINEKETSLLSYGDTIDQLVAYKKKEYDDIRNQIITAEHQLAMVRDKTTKDMNELERWKRNEKQKFEDETSKIQNDIIFKQNLINNEVLQQERITIDLRTQQQKFESLKQDQLRLREELVKLEGKKIEIENLHRQTQIIHDSAISSQNQGSMALAKAAEDAEKNKQENIRLSALNDSLTNREKKLTEDIQSHQTLKEFVEPKIMEIQEQQANLDKSKKENDETISKLMSTINEEKILLASIQDKKLQLDKDNKDFLSQKEEFQRQQLLTSIK